MPRFIFTPPDIRIIRPRRASSSRAAMLAVDEDRSVGAGRGNLRYGPPHRGGPRRMADLPSRSALEDALDSAAMAHEEYESIALKGVADDRWAEFYAAYLLGRLGEFTPPSRLAALLEEVDVPGDWSAAAAEYVLMKLRS